MFIHRYHVQDGWVDFPELGRRAQLPLDQATDALHFELHHVFPYFLIFSEHIDPKFIQHNQPKLMFRWCQVVHPFFIKEVMFSQWFLESSRPNSAVFSRSTRFARSSRSCISDLKTRGRRCWRSTVDHGPIAEEIPPACGWWWMLAVLLRRKVVERYGEPDMVKVDLFFLGATPLKLEGPSVFTWNSLSPSSNVLRFNSLNPMNRAQREARCDARQLPSVKFEVWELSMELARTTRKGAEKDAVSLFLLVGMQWRQTKQVQCWWSNGDVFALLPFGECVMFERHWFCEATFSQSQQAFQAPKTNKTCPGQMCQCLCQSAVALGFLMIPSGRWPSVLEGEFGATTGGARPSLKFWDRWPKRSTRGLEGPIGWNRGGGASWWCRSALCRATQYCNVLRQTWVLNGISLQSSSNTIRIEEFISFSQPYLWHICGKHVRVFATYLRQKVDHFKKSHGAVVAVE